MSVEALHRRPFIAPQTTRVHLTSVTRNGSYDLVFLSSNATSSALGVTLRARSIVFGVSRSAFARAPHLEAHPANSPANVLANGTLGGVETARDFTWGHFRM